MYVSAMGSAMGSVVVAQLLMNQITIKLRSAVRRVTRVRKREAVIDFYMHMYTASLACFTCTTPHNIIRYGNREWHGGQ